MSWRLKTCLFLLKLFIWSYALNVQSAEISGCDQSNGYYPLVTKSSPLGSSVDYSVMYYKAEVKGHLSDSKDLSTLGVGSLLGTHPKRISIFFFPGGPAPAQSQINGLMESLDPRFIKNIYAIDPRGMGCNGMTKNLESQKEFGSQSLSFRSHVTDYISLLKPLTFHNEIERDGDYLVYGYSYGSTVGTAFSHEVARLGLPQPKLAILGGLVTKNPFKNGRFDLANAALSGLLDELWEPLFFQNSPISRDDRFPYFQQKFWHLKNLKSDLEELGRISFPTKAEEEQRLSEFKETKKGIEEIESRLDPNILKKLYGLSPKAQAGFELVFRPLDWEERRSWQKRYALRYELWPALFPKTSGNQWPDKALADETERFEQVVRFLESLAPDEIKMVQKEESYDTPQDLVDPWDAFHVVASEMGHFVPRAAFHNIYTDLPPAFDVKDYPITVPVVYLQALQDLTTPIFNLEEHWMKQEQNPNKIGVVSNGDHNFGASILPCVSAIASFAARDNFSSVSHLKNELVKALQSKSNQPGLLKEGIDKESLSIAIACEIITGGNKLVLQHKDILALPHYLKAKKKYDQIIKMLSN